MMATDTTERPNVEEQYQTASNTSNLTVEAEKRGSADIIIAAGWSPSRVGMALLRLHSEWDSAAKPQRATRAQIEMRIAAMKEADERERQRRTAANGELARLEALRSKALDAGEQPGFDLLVEIMEQRRLWEKKALPLPEFKVSGTYLGRANEEASRWYINELRILAVSLKSRAAVWEQLTYWMGRKGIDPDVIAEALLHWLAPTCPQCEGHGFQRVPNQPALSNRRCQNSRCQGGTLKPPMGTASVLAYMDDCVNKARQSLKYRLRNNT